MKLSIPSRTYQLLCNILENMQLFNYETVISSVTQLTGGVTNKLYKVSFTSNVPQCAKIKSVVVRLFGENTDVIIDRNSDMFWQSHFLYTYGKYKNIACIYDYLENTQPLSPVQTKLLWVQCANLFASIHLKTLIVQREFTNNIIIPSDRIYPFIPASSINNPVDMKSLEKIHCKPIFIKDNLNAWMKEANTSIKGLSNTNLIQACHQVLHIISKIEHSLPVGPCHNDLHGLNILISKEINLMNIKSDSNEIQSISGSQLTPIDFEYCQHNYLIYDLSNHFNEYCGFECNNALYPSDQDIIVFVRQYINEFRRIINNKEEFTISQPTAQYLSMTLSKLELAQRDIVPFIKIFGCASHLIWCLWAIKQSKSSTCDMNYEQYAIDKFNSYIYLKEQIQEYFTD